jgi:hypothetical protein
MSTLDKILDLVKNFGQRRAKTSAGNPRNVRPASEDPYGDPADEFKGRNVKPASTDPYGDPADEPRRR